MTYCLTNLLLAWSVQPPELPAERKAPAVGSNSQRVLLPAEVTESALNLLEVLVLAAASHAEGACKETTQGPTLADGVEETLEPCLH